MGSLNRYNVFESTTVDEVHLNNSVIYEDILGRPLMQPLHGFPECMLQINACFSRFLSCMRNIALLHQWLSTT